MIVSGRWHWTADRKRLVKEGDEAAAFLAYPHGTEIPDLEAERVGLKIAARPVDKMSPAPLNKRRRPQDG